MFAKKTVFVVGAGGSFEIGLPVGADLKGIIRSKLDIPSQGMSNDPASETMRRAAIYYGKKQLSMGIGADFNTFMHKSAAAAQAIRAAMPQAISIDNYLHTHASDPNIVLMGKFGIAASILESERKSAIWRKEKGAHYIDFSVKDSWHNTFCKMLTENVQLNDLDTVFDNVTFITFNYDRCIEHYVLHWLITYARLSFDDGVELCKKLRIFHPYGQVGRLPWQAEHDGIEFGAEYTEHTIIAAASQIKTFTERVDDHAMLDQMHNAISDSERLIYLGFSFGKMNMDLLEVNGPGVDKDVYGTVLHVSTSNKNAIHTRIANSVFGEGKTLVDSWNLQDSTANQLLNDYWYELSE